MRSVSLAACLLSLIVSAPALAQDGTVTGAAAVASANASPTRFARVQIAIVAIEPQPVAGDGKTTPPFPTLERIVELEEAGKLRSVARAEVVAGDGAEAYWQEGERQQVAVGRTFGGRGGTRGEAPPQFATTFQNQDVGTIIRVKPHIDENKVVTELTVEQSGLPAAAANDPKSDESKPEGPPTTQPISKNHTLKTTVSLRNGQPQIVGGYQTVTTDNSTRRETFHLVIATVDILQP